MWRWLFRRDEFVKNVTKSSDEVLCKIKETAPEALEKLKSG
jgi:hypothetical protein